MGQQPSRSVQIHDYTMMDDDEAFLAYRKAAKQGGAAAQHELGIWYQRGEMDEVEGVKWYRKAAEQGHAGAQFPLSLAYGMGRGVAGTLRATK